jgi:hypothetical protein
MVRVALYSKPGCHLCESVEQVIMAVALVSLSIVAARVATRSAAPPYAGERAGVRGRS